MKISFKHIPSLLATLVLSSLIITSCSKSTKGGKNPQNISGWGTNDKDGWLFIGDNPASQIHKGMVFVKGGTFVMGKVTEDVLMDYTNSPVRTNVPSFLLAENEITNYDYLQYISWLEYVFPKENAGSKSIIQGASPDKNVWRNNSSTNNVIGRDYFTHPSYSTYPVVGVSWIQAQRYCDWLTDRVNEKYLIDKGIVKNNLYTDSKLLSDKNIFSSNAFERNPKALSKDSLSIIDSTKIYPPIDTKTLNSRAIYKTYGNNVVARFRLPTEAEWEYAAIGIVPSKSSKSKVNIYKGNDVFQKQMLGGKSKRGSSRSKVLDNGLAKGVHNINTFSITNNVKSMPANGLGLYGMYGNVSEWVQDSYNIVISNKETQNKGLKNKFDDEDINSLPKKIDLKDVEFDTLSDGRVLYKALPGDYAYDNVSNAKDSTSSVKQKKSSDLTTYVKDNSKVIKGASWKDNSYWIDPGQRRFLSEDRSNNWVGFRVAQDNSGALGNKK